MRVQDLQARLRDLPPAPLDPQQELPGISPEFGHWLAGFADGEGCFDIGRPSRDRNGLNLRFTIELRADDRAILEHLQEVTGIGQVSAVPQREERWNPGAKWTVYRKADLVRLVRIFDAYPLRAKKARDYAIWREAVGVASIIRQQGQRPADWSRVAELGELLRATRAYKDFPASTEELRAEVASLQAQLTFKDERWTCLREAGDDLLRAFLMIADYEHPAAERYRAARAAVEDFGEGE